MSGGRRRGSSTRKHRINQLEIQKTAYKKNPPKEKPRLTDQEVIAQLEEMLRSGLNRKNKALSDAEINKAKIKIADLEDKLGIIHED